MCNFMTPIKQVELVGRAGCAFTAEDARTTAQRLREVVPCAMAQLRTYMGAANVEADVVRHNVARQWQMVLAESVPKSHALERKASLCRVGIEK